MAESSMDEAYVDNTVQFITRVIVPGVLHLTEQDPQWVSRWLYNDDLENPVETREKLVRRVVMANEGTSGEWPQSSSSEGWIEKARDLQGKFVSALWEARTGAGTLNLWLKVKQTLSSNPIKYRASCRNGNVQALAIDSLNTLLHSVMGGVQASSHSAAVSSNGETGLHGHATGIATPLWDGMADWTVADLFESLGGTWPNPSEHAASAQTTHHSQPASADGGGSKRQRLAEATGSDATAAAAAAAAESSDAKVKKGRRNAASAPAVAAETDQDGEPDPNRRGELQPVRSGWCYLTDGSNAAFIRDLKVYEPAEMPGSWRVSVDGESRVIFDMEFDVAPMKTFAKAEPREGDLRIRMRILHSTVTGLPLFFAERLVYNSRGWVSLLNSGAFYRSASEALQALGKNGCDRAMILCKAPMKLIVLGNEFQTLLKRILTADVPGDQSIVDEFIRLFPTMTEAWLQQIRVKYRDRIGLQPSSSAA